jgi:phosphate starvation-inducible PhoH-like protein
MIIFVRLQKYIKYYQMATKRALRKKKESGELQQEFVKAYKKNFDCSEINIKKMLPLTSNQMSCLDLSLQDNTNIVFISGIAGTAKTYLAVYSALNLLKSGKADQIIYIRSVVESSSRSIGALPGFLEDKFSVYTMPLQDKLNEIIDITTSKSLLEQEYIKAIPVNFIRGLTFNNSVIIVDESQNMDRAELTTILSRFGRNSRYFVLGDPKQADVKSSGFSKVIELFNTEHSRKNNIHCVEFGVDDVVRSPILKHITQVLGV